MGSEITKQPGRRISWASLPDASVDNAGTIEFRPSTEGRGTEVRALISFKPPMGGAGRMVAGWMQRPHRQAKRDLRRFKQLMETGEIQTSPQTKTNPLPEHGDYDMRALVWHGRHDMRVQHTVPDPVRINPRDAIIKITSTAICGSDLHIYNGLIPSMKSGDILGHEFMGEVVDVDASNTKLKVGDRVVVPFVIACGPVLLL